MRKVFYFFPDTDMRRKVVRGELDCPGANYMYYGADGLSKRGFAVQHNLEDKAPPSRWIFWLAWLVDQGVKRAGGPSGNFLTAFRNWRRARRSDIVVSTVDNVGEPLAYLNYFGLLYRPLLYISIGLPERIATLTCPFMKFFYRRMYRRLPRLVAYGWEEAIRLREWLGLPPDSEQVIFLPFGVDHRAFTPRPGSRETVDVLSIGADVQRDFPLLVESARQLPGFSFQIITSTHHAAALDALPPNVTVLTSVPFQEIQQHLAGARVIALPCRENTYSGGTTTLLQAMAMAKPVVVTETGAIRQGYHLEDRVNCRLAPAGSAQAMTAALSELLDDPALRSGLGANARQTIEQYLTWDHYVAGISNLVSALADPSR